MKAYIASWYGGAFTIHKERVAGSRQVELDEPTYTRLQNAQKQAQKLQKELSGLFYARPA